MNPIIIIGIAGFVISLYAYGKIMNRKHSMHTAERAALTLGLAEEDASFSGPRVFAGIVNGTRVRLFKHPDRLFVEISITAGMPDDMRVSGVHGTSNYAKSSRDCDIISGDEAFNTWLRVEASDKTEALAFLDSKARKTILELYHRTARIEVTSRALTLAFNTSRTPYHNRWALVKIVRATLEAVKNLERRDPSSRRGAYAPRPLTPPYVPFGIRRFLHC
jgi:hypothetical protein